MYNKWSKWFDIRPHRCYTWTAQSYSPGGADVHPTYTKPNKWLPWQRPFGAGYRQYLYSVSRPLKPTSITNRLVTIVHTKPVNSNFSLTRKPTPRIRQRVASYHTTKVIAHQRPEPIMANCVPTLVAMATSLSTCESPSNTWFPEPTQVLYPNGISYGSAVFAQMTAECPYTLQWDAPFPSKTCPFPWWIWTPI